MEKYDITSYFEGLPPNEWISALNHRYEVEYHGVCTPENVAFNQQMGDFDKFSKDNNIEIEDYFPLIDLKPIIKALGALCQSIAIPHSEITLVDFLKEIYQKLPNKVKDEYEEIILEELPKSLFHHQLNENTHINLSISGTHYNRTPSKNAYKASVYITHEDEHKVLVEILRDI